MSILYTNFHYHIFLMKIKEKSNTPYFFLSEAALAIHLTNIIHLLFVIFHTNKKSGYSRIHSAASRLFITRFASIRSKPVFSATSCAGLTHLSLQRLFPADTASLYSQAVLFIYQTATCTAHSTALCTVRARHASRLHKCLLLSIRRCGQHGGSSPDDEQ